MKKNLLIVAWLLPLTICATAALAETEVPPAPDPEIIGPILRVTNLDRSVKFYTEGLGLSILMKIPEGAGLATIVAPKGKSVPPIISLVQQDKDPAKSAPVIQGTGYSRTAISVANTAQMYAHLKALGYAPTGDGKGGIFFVSDPDGYRYEITQRGMQAPKPIP